MIAVALVQGNLAVEIGERLADGAPADFYIDIQPDQLAGFERIVAAVPGARFEQVPMLRGRITRLERHAGRTGRGGAGGAMGAAQRARPDLCRRCRRKARASSPASGGRPITAARR